MAANAAFAKYKSEAACPDWFAAVFEEGLPGPDDVRSDKPIADFWQGVADSVRDISGVLVSGVGAERVTTATRCGVRFEIARMMAPLKQLGLNTLAGANNVFIIKFVAEPTMPKLNAGMYVNAVLEVFDAGGYTVNPIPMEPGDEFALVVE
jgi:hypothetical protein